MGAVGKGSLKRKHSQLTSSKGKTLRSEQDFQDSRENPANLTNETEQAAKWQRMDKESYECVIKSYKNGVLDARNADGDRLNARVLRPRTAQVPPCKMDIRSEMNTNRIFNMKHLLDLINQSICYHNTHSTDCSLPQFEWDFESEVQQGLAWTERLRCVKCNIKPRPVKVFDAVKRENGASGRDSAQINLQLQVGLAHSMISNTAMYRILACCNIPPPSLSGMQYQTNKVGNKLIAIAKNDMREQRINLKNQNEMKGLPADTPIRGHIDSRYNNGLNTGRGRTPFQPGTIQATTITEGETGKNKAIGFAYRSKLCATGSRSGTSIMPHCPPHTGHCSQTIPYDASIGDEKHASEMIMKEFIADPEANITFKYVTSDADSHGVQGIASQQETDPEHLLDTRHFGESVGRAVENATFSDRAFPGSTKQDRQRVQKNFAHNFKRRAAAEFKAAHAQYGENTEELTNKLSHALLAQIACFNDDCGEKCAQYSLVCSGMDDEHKWDHEYLDLEGKDTSIFFVDEDVQQLRAILAKRLGREGIQKTRFNTNTQHLEALHRKFTACNPKQVTMPRNSEARLHSALHCNNHGLAGSIFKKLELIDAPLTRDSRPYNALLSMEEMIQSQRRHQKSPQAKRHRADRRRASYRMHSKKREKVTYEKDLLLKRVKSVKLDHQYQSNREPDHAYSKLTK